MTKKRTDFVMLSRAVWEDVMIDELDPWDCKLLLTLVLAANYKDHKLAYSVRSFCQDYKWRDRVLQRHMRILEDKGFVRVHMAKNQNATGYVEVLKYDLLVKGPAVPPAVPPGVVAATTAQAPDLGKPETNGEGKTQDVVDLSLGSSRYPLRPQKAAASAGESELLTGTFEERRTKAKAKLDEIAKAEADAS